MQLWYQGKSSIEVRPEVGDGRLKILYRDRLLPVWKSQVKDYCDTWFFSCFDVWYRWKTFGCLPFSGGWAEQPFHLVQIIETADIAYKQASNQ